MSENIEFISAKDLPITEAKEVDVLCVENGEMKRKPANGLGGGGYDVVMRMEPNSEMLTLEKGSYSEVIDKLMSNETVSACIMLGQAEEASVFYAVAVTKFAEEELVLFTFGGLGQFLVIALNPNNEAFFD